MIHYAALVHDIGKIAQRPDVIRKPTPLTEEERRSRCATSEAGAKIVETDPSACSGRDGADAPLAPGMQRVSSGLTEAEVPLGARIIYVCDAFDAMTSDCSAGACRSTAR